MDERKKERMNEWMQAFITTKADLLENNMSSTLTSILLIERFGNFRSNFPSTLTSLLHIEDSFDDFRSNVPIAESSFDFG